MISSVLSKDQMAQLADLQYKYEVFDVPDLLFHYTKFDTADLILSSEGIKFRLTDINNFSDITEGRLIQAYYEIALNNLLSKKVITTYEYDRLICIDVPEKTLIVSDKKIGSSSEFRVYVGCFSTIAQDEYMYENYIKNESHKGYCLQIPSWILKNQFDKRGIALGCKYSLSPVIYGSRIVDEIENYLTDAKNICHEFSVEIMKKALDTIIKERLFDMRPITKLDRYRKENEVRLIVYLPKSRDNTVAFPDFINEVDEDHIEICFDKHLYGLYPHNVPEKEHEGFLIELQKRGYPSIAT